MKKILALILALVAVFAFAACSDGNANETTPEGTDTVAPSGDETNLPDEVVIDYDTEFNITVISGTTGMGFANMMTENNNGNGAFKYNFDIVTAADIASSAIISGSADIAAVPTNLAAVLYNKTNGGIKALAVNTLGVLYLIENGEGITDTSGLAGKTIYCCQQGANPEYITSYILEQNGYEVGKDVFLDFTYNAPDDLANALIAGEVDLAVLPEPKVTTTLMKNDSLRVALNFTEEWEKVSGGQPLPQGCIIARNEFIEAHPNEVNAFLEEYKKSVDFVNESPEEASAMIAELKIIPNAQIALKAIPGCNIAYLDGEEMASAMSSFFTVLHSKNSKAVGGMLPDENIFYKGK